MCLAAGAVLLSLSATAEAQQMQSSPTVSYSQGAIGAPGIDYAQTIAAGDGAQMYPYDQQDPWLHGHFQRYPAYGGFASFRPYNYRHVFSQTQISTAWGSAHGMPYSQQFWNKYRPNYLNGELHAQSAWQPAWPVLPPGTATQLIPVGAPRSLQPVAPVHSIGYPQHSTATGSDPRPVHVFPGQ
jgi:hypothetical protein